MTYRRGSVIMSEMQAVKREGACEGFLRVRAIGMGRAILRSFLSWIKIGEKID